MRATPLLPTSRRRFLRAAALVPAAVAAGCASPSGHRSGAPQHAFFTAAEAEFIDAATNRLIPNDELGPGANQAGVTGFLDVQLAGAYGRASRWYMRGPWADGTDEQGYQSRLTPAEMYRAAIAAIDDKCVALRGKRFAALDDKAQDDVLAQIESGSLGLHGVPEKQFFQLLWQNTQEGYLADPVYGGNRDFAGWKLIGFPGPRYNYLDEIEHYGQRYTRPFVSLAGRDPDNQREA
ncbi:MAG TPA: gluconate 2-dehydrogenase subunit 3 family protein [Rhodanobacteraceae bacterium]|nr:gluconate 2-dehydrogenase subunit 3 family protein [Rhodanobacteraceae bacterium]